MIMSCIFIVMAVRVLARRSIRLRSTIELWIQGLIFVYWMEMTTDWLNTRSGGCLSD